MLLRLLLASLLAAPGCAYSGPEAYRGERGWVVDANQAIELLAAGASALDVRELEAYQLGHVQGAVHTLWLDFSDGDPDYERGRLLADEAALNAKIQALGVDRDRPVVVIGDPIQGWGEDGRILWMLRALGHEEAALVDGGFAALEFAGAAITRDPPVSSRGDFVAVPSDRWSIERDALAELIDANESTLRLVDTREPREFDGETPYGEQRGGHVPGAVNIYYRELLTPAGYLRSRSKILALLEQRQIGPKDAVVAYCTGGVRSAWFVAVLQDLGFENVRNYAGSMWEWAAAPEDLFPLED